MCVFNKLLRYIAPVRNHFHAHKHTHVQTHSESKSGDCRLTRQPWQTLSHTCAHANTHTHTHTHTQICYCRCQLLGSAGWRRPHARAHVCALPHNTFPVWLPKVPGKFHHQKGFGSHLSLCVCVCVCTFVSVRLCVYVCVCGVQTALRLPIIPQCHFSSGGGA